MSKHLPQGWLGKTGVIVLVAAVALTLAYAIWALMVGQRVNSLPAITTREELAAALSGEPTAYRLLDIPMDGEPVKDPLGLLEGDYVYVYWQKQTVERKIRRDGTREKNPTYSWKTSGHEEALAPLKLFGEIPLEGNYQAETQGVLALRPDMFTSRAASRVEEGDMAYYPGTRNQVTGAERYRLRAAVRGEKAVLMATVGNGRAIAHNPTGDIPMVIFGGDNGSLSTNAAGRYVLLLIAVWVVAGIVVLVRALRRKI